MKGKMFSEIQFKLIINNEKNSFWEVSKNNPETVSSIFSTSKYKIGEILYLKEPYWRDSNTKKTFLQIRSGEYKRFKKLSASQQETPSRILEK